MEYILINESKLKITLEGDELEERSLESEQLDYADPRAKKLFCDLLAKARNELGFDTTGYRVLIQLYPIREGGCELYVTRLGKLDDPVPSEDESELDCPPKKDSSKKSKKQKHKRAYRFENLSDLCNVCKRLRDSQTEFESSAYLLSEEWYLLLKYEDADEICDILPINDLSFISEYGYPEDARVLSLYLSEHAKQICTERAVEKLSRI